MDRSASSVTPPATRSFGTWLVAMPTWKKASLIVATLMLLMGWIFGLSPEASADSTRGGASGLQAGLLPTNQGQSTPVGAENLEEPAARGIFRLGFSFLVGFCLGSFLRATMRLASIAIGFWLAMTLLLSYYGLVVVDWQAVDGLWDQFVGNVENEWSNFQSFLTGSLPAAGLAIAGLAAGLKRH
jgi:uncharacterized membrane protein (Fun14 family)